MADIVDLLSETRKRRPKRVDLANNKAIVVATTTI